MIENLSVAYDQGGHLQTVLRDIDLTIEPGQAYGLVGESGSGKSTLALAAMRSLSGSGRIGGGSIELAGVNLLDLDPEEMRLLWRSRIKLVPQDAGSSLNPRLKVGRQIAEGLDLVGRQRQASVHELLGRVGLADPLRVANSYPHQLSGGMQQRVMIAMALGGTPELLILDEPTTNLDVTTEATILDLVKDLLRERNTAVLYVSHSLGVVAQLCDRVAVLYAGELVEDATVEGLYNTPLHPYTRGLLDSVPQIGKDRRREELRPVTGSIPEPGALPAGCVFAPRCPLANDFTRENRPQLESAGLSRRVRCHRWQEVAEGAVSPRQPGRDAVHAGTAVMDRAGELVLEVSELEKRFPLRRGLGELIAGRPAAAVSAVAGVDLSIRRRRTLGLVGESGSGKSTLARCIIGLITPTGGSMKLLDIPLQPRLSQRGEKVLRRLQMVFQNADEALNPYLTVGASLRRPLERLAGASSADLGERLAALLEAVRLSTDYADRYPSELSGGEKQRVAIARAFASEPDLLLFDESVSGLDVSVQASILNLLSGLQLERESAYLFISHDLAVVGYLADEIAVIYRGQLMETGPTDAVFEPPYHPYTEALLSAIPLLDPTVRKERIRLRGENGAPAGSSTDAPGGCPFHTRCPRFLGAICVNEDPPWQEHESGKRIYCHIPLAELELMQERPVASSSRSGTELDD